MKRIGVGSAAVAPTNKAIAVICSRCDNSRRVAANVTIALPDDACSAGLVVVLQQGDVEINYRVTEQLLIVRPCGSVLVVGAATQHNYEVGIDRERVVLQHGRSLRPHKHGVEVGAVRECPRSDTCHAVAYNHAGNGFRLLCPGISRVDPIDHDTGTEDGQCAVVERPFQDGVFRALEVCGQRGVANQPDSDRVYRVTGAPMVKIVTFFGLCANNHRGIAAYIAVLLLYNACNAGSVII